jgi:GPH family glycoside/pentoside/hexuronide:cation symporter
MVLGGAMVLAIASFVLTLGLPMGSALGFAAICVVSGAALGADMTLLPALFARRIAGFDGAEAIGFGLWSFASKLSLALAALLVLPLLQWLGFTGPSSPASALWGLSLLYAGLPCLLKLISLVVLATIPNPDLDQGNSR